jgi:hypothetical protein
MIIYFYYVSREASRMSNSLEAYHASHRSPAIINHNRHNVEIGRVFAEYKDKLVLVLPYLK